MQIPFYFDPIPTFFRNKGFFKPKKNMSHLIDYFLIGLFISRCRRKPHSEYFDGKLFHLEAFEFVCGREKVSQETGIPENVIRHRLETWQNQGLLKKSANSIPNRITFYIWSTEVFSEHNHQLNHQQTTNSPPTEAPLTKSKKKKSKEEREYESSSLKAVDITTPANGSSSFFYDCLKEVDIEEVYKQDLTKEFPEIKVAEAVAYVSDVRFVMKKSIEHTLFWFCRSKKHILHPETPKPEWERLALKHNEIYAEHFPKGFIKNQELIKNQKMMIWQIDSFVPISLGNPCEELKKDFERAAKEYKIAMKNRKAQQKIEKVKFKEA